jgi:hypothetical protein
MHAPAPKATMKEMLKFIGMLGAPVVAPAVMLRAGEDHMLKFPHSLRTGIAAIQRAKFWPRPPRILVSRCNRSAMISHVEV